MSLHILYYDLLKGYYKGTASTHVHEILTNLVKHGQNVLLYGSNPHSPWYRHVEKRDPKPGLGNRLAEAVPSLGIFLSFLGEARTFFKGIIALKKVNQKPDLVYYRHSLFNSGYWLARWLKVAAIKEVNGILAHEMKVTGSVRYLPLKIIDRIERYSFPKADKIIVVTTRLKETLTKVYEVPEDKVVVLENGANTDLFKPVNNEKLKEKLSLEQDSNYICFCGNFVAWQGLEVLLRCMPLVLKECPSACLLLVGDGELKNKLFEIAREINILDKIVFTGLVPHEKVHCYINASDVCAAPFVSERNEQSGVSPLKLCEYMACGKPVVASRISGLEAIEEYKTGILIKPDAPVELAKAIITLLKNPHLGKKMGLKGRLYVIENRSWESIAMKTIDTFKETVEDIRKKKMRAQLEETT